MAPFRGLPHTTGSAGGSDWLCFARSSIPAGSGLPSGSAATLCSIRNPQSRNWVCLAQCAAALARLVAPPSRAPRGPFRQIGFVLPKPIAGTMYHNSFPARHLPLPQVRRKLALFGACMPRRARPATRARLGLFGAFAPRPPSLWPRPARRSRANWLCSARSAPAGTPPACPG